MPFQNAIYSWIAVVIGDPYNSVCTDMSPSVYNQRPYRLRQGAIGTSYGDWHCSGATYLVAGIALLTLRAAHAKYGETRCTISSCLAL